MQVRNQNFFRVGRKRKVGGGGGGGGVVLEIGPLVNIFSKKTQEKEAPH